MSVKTLGFENGYEMVAPVATTATLAAYEVMGWDNLTGVFKPATTLTELSTTLATTTAVAFSSLGTIVYGTPEILSLSTGTALTKITTSYSGKTITVSSHTKNAHIHVTYLKLDYEPSALLSEAVGHDQALGYAKLLVNGVVNSTDVDLEDDLIARLARNGIIVLEREEVV